MAKDKDSDKKPKLTAEEFAADYGFAWELIGTEPDLVKLFEKAVAGDWTDPSGNPSPRFYTELYKTPWYKNSADRWKQAFTRENGNDATWEKRLIPTGRDAVLAAAEALGSSCYGSSLFLQAAGEGRQNAGLADPPFSLAVRRVVV